MWVERIDRRFYLEEITLDTTGRDIAQLALPVASTEYVLVRIGTRNWQPKMTAREMGVYSGDTIRTTMMLLGGMNTHLDDTMDDGVETKSSHSSLASYGEVDSNKRQRIQPRQHTLDNFITPSPTRPAHTSPLDHSTQLDSDEDTQASPSVSTSNTSSTHHPAPPHSTPPRRPAGSITTPIMQEVRQRYKDDPFTKAFHYKIYPAHQLSTEQRLDLTELMMAQVQQIVDLVITANTLHVGPMRMSQIPDVIHQLHAMGYPLDIQQVLEQISTNTQQQYVHTFDRKKPDRCTITVVLTHDTEFTAIPVEGSLRPIWKQFTMPINAGETSYIKVQPCHAPEDFTYPLCTFYDIHTGTMQLDMIQHCYFILKQALSEEQFANVLIEFRMGGVNNPDYKPKDPKSKKRITTTFGIVRIRKPMSAGGINLVEWINPIQARIQARITKRGTNSRSSILQGPYEFGITMGRYQDVPPSYQTLNRPLTSDPLICLLHLFPQFLNHGQLGAAIDGLSSLLLSSNLILSIHIRDDWVREEGNHPPRLSIAFTMTGPMMTEAVRSIVQSEIQTIMSDPRIMVIIPNPAQAPQPWTRVVELPTSHDTPPTTVPTRGKGPNSSPNTPRGPQARRSPSTSWSAITRMHPTNPITTQTYDTTAMASLPTAITQLNQRMDIIERTAAADRAEAERAATAAKTDLDAKFGSIFSLLQALTTSVDSLAGARVAPARDPHP